MYKISKEFHFSASHQLGHLPEDHPCHNLHGHNYVVTIGFEAKELDKNGFVIDFRDLDGMKQFIDNNFDHKHLNDVFPFNAKLSTYTTSENLAEYLFVICRDSGFYNDDNPTVEVSFVKVAETPKTMAEYSE